MNIVRIWAGMGNQMFQYAYARALSERSKYPVYLDVNYININERMDGSVIKSVSHQFTEREYALKNFKISIPALDKIWLDLSYFMLRKVSDEHDVYSLDRRLTGRENFMYYNVLAQNTNYFENIRPILLKEFRPEEKIKVVHDLSFLLKNAETVALHVRRGDYVRLQLAQSWEGYYQKAIDIIKREVKNPVFLVFSDDIDWVRQRFEGQADIYYISNGTYKDYEELLIMSKCKHMIISNSTFSFWGAWLNQHTDKIVLVPKKASPVFTYDNWRRI